MGIAHELRGKKKTMKTQCKNSSSFNLGLRSEFPLATYSSHLSVEISAWSLLGLRGYLHVWSTWSTMKASPCFAAEA